MSSLLERFPAGACPDKSWKLQMFILFSSTLPDGGRSDRQMEKERPTCLSSSGRRITGPGTRGLMGNVLRETSSNWLRMEAITQLQHGVICWQKLCWRYHFFKRHKTSLLRAKCQIIFNSEFQEAKYFLKPFLIRIMLLADIWLRKWSVLLKGTSMVQTLVKKAKPVTCNFGCQTFSTNLASQNSTYR